MADAPINDVLKNAFRDTVAEWKQNGLSERLHNDYLYTERYIHH